MLNSIGAHRGQSTEALEGKLSGLADLSHFPISMLMAGRRENDAISKKTNRDGMDIDSDRGL